MNAEPLLGALFGLALLAFAGRVLLAWLPPGEPGRHRAADLPATWAASHLVGWMAFHTASGFAGEVGLRFSWTSFAAPCALLAALRLAALPGAMVPRHDGRPPRATWTGRLALAAFALALLWIPAQALRAAEYALPTEPGELAAWRAARPFEACVLRLARPAHLVALGIWTAHGLAALDVRPAARRLAGLAVIALPAWWSTRDGVVLDAQLALTFGAGAASGLHWFARADRRALALALLAFGACLAEAPAGVPLGLAGLATLGATLHRDARRLAWPWALLALAVVALPWRLVRIALELGDCTRADLALSAGALGPRGLLAGALDWRSGGPLWLPALAAAAWVWLRAGRADPRPGRFLAALAVLAALLHAPWIGAQECLPELGGASWSQFTLRAAPAAAALLALALGRAERA